MTKIDYEKQAAECLKLAKQTPNSEHKTLLLSMARSWQSLADKAQKIETLQAEPGQSDEENRKAR